MREVDDALARAYAQRGQSDLPQGVPPAPHLPPRVLESRTSSASRHGVFCRVAMACVSPLT